MDRQSGNEEPSSKNPDYRQYLTSRLKWFNEATQAYMHRQVTNLQFAKYRSTQTAMTQMAREIVGEVDVVGHKLEEKSCRIVFMGNCSTPANSTIRGHRRAPTGKKLSRYLQQRRNVIIISTPETNSTKNCSRCYEPLDNVESSKERLKICTKFCTPARDSMPAHHITTYTSKRSIKRKMKKVGTKPSQSERKSRVSMNRIDRWSIDDKIRIAKRLTLKRTIYVGPIPARHNILWNRDINAARNIGYLGLCRYGKFIDSSLNTTENTAFSRST
ncbi:uncharacterized protein LOC119082896 [Bradysia coprophila]|uniref:uncharacterized protein LOC119082896 n=1 Tax=Bradysia coprophila TaxID=38358 RepID=UPI00187DC7B6|nr:uncharacterized protein LOC119082896 [Bradysia coprophila]